MLCNHIYGAIVLQSLLVSTGTCYTTYAETASLSWSTWPTGFNGFQSSYAYKPVTALEEGKEKSMAR